MNLIQIKQIDGLTTTLNSLARGLFDLEEEATGQFQHALRIYDQLSISSGPLGGEYIDFNGGGDNLNEEDPEKYIDGTGVFNNVKVKISEGSLLVEDTVLTDTMTCNQINCDNFSSDGVVSSTVKSTNFLHEDENTGRITDIINKLTPNYKSFDLSTNYPVYLENEDDVAIFYNNSANGVVSEIYLPPSPRQGQEVLIKVVGTGLTADNGNVFMIRPEDSNHKIEGNQNWGINWDYGYAKLLYLGDVANEWVITSSNFGRFNFVSTGSTPDPVNGPTNPFNVLTNDIEYVNAQFPIQQNIIDTMSGLVDQLSGQVYDVSTELDSVIADVDLISGNCC